MSDKDFCQYFTRFITPLQKADRSESTISELDILMSARIAFDTDGERGSRSWLLDFARCYEDETAAACAWANQFYEKHLAEIEGNK